MAPKTTFYTVSIDYRDVHGITGMHYIVEARDADHARQIAIDKADAEPLFLEYGIAGVEERRTPLRSGHRVLTEDGAYTVE